MDEIIIEDNGSIEHYQNYSDNLDIIRIDPSGYENNSQTIQETETYDTYVYTPVPEEVEEYKEGSHAADLIEEEKEEIKEEKLEEEEEEDKDVKEVQYVYIKSNSVSDNDVADDHNSVETVSMNTVQYIIDTPLNEYKLTDSLLLIIILMGLFFGLVHLIRRSVFKWN